MKWLHCWLFGHVFHGSDLKMNNRDGDEDRVTWPCAKCGKAFYMHCGLNNNAGKIEWDK